MRVKEHFDHYPAFRGSALRVSRPMGGLDSRSEKRGMGLGLEWRSGTQALMLADTKSLDDLGVARYRSADDAIVTPAIGSMVTGLHPFLACGACCWRSRRWRGTSQQIPSCNRELGAFLIGR